MVTRPAFGSGCVIVAPNTVVRAFVDISSTVDMLQRLDGAEPFFDWFATSLIDELVTPAISNTLDLSLEDPKNDGQRRVFNFSGGAPKPCT